MKCKLFRGALALGLALFLGHAGGATAQNESQAAAWSGATILFSGNAVNINQFNANWGNDMINGVPTHVFGANWVTKTAPKSPATAIFCNDVPGKVQAGSAVYYVYYATYNNGTQLTHVVSTIAPTPTGEPSANLVFTVGKFSQNDRDAVFLGSYMTSGGGDMIPFERNGEEVILTSHAQIGAPAGVVFPAAGVYPMAQAIGGYLLPASASAAIVDLNVASAALAAPPPAHDVFILDPFLTAATCNPFSQVDLLPSSANTVQYDQVRVRVSPGEFPLNALTFDLCNAPGGAITIKAFLAGYVEPFHHLDN